MGMSRYWSSFRFAFTGFFAKNHGPGGCVL